MRSLLSDGPATATGLAARLGLTSAAVRRHLDQLLLDGTIEARDLPPYGPVGRRGRGRPAKVFSAHRGRPGLLRAGLRRPGRRCPAPPPARDGRRRRPRLRPGSGRHARGARTPCGRRSRTRGPAAGSRGCAHRRGLRRLGRRRTAGRRTSSASTTARSRTSPPSSPSCARPRPRRSPSCSARHVQRLATIAHGDGVCTTVGARTLHRCSCHRTTPERIHIDDQPSTTDPELEGLGRYEYGWSDSDAAGANARRGLSEDVVRDISALQERAAVDARPAAQGPAALRQEADADLGLGPRPASTSTTSSTSSARRRSRPTSWDDLPDDIKNTYDRLGIPEAEKQRLVSGVAAQYESEVVYHQIREDLEQQGVIFVDTDTGAARARGPVPGVLRHRSSRPATTSSPR